MVDKVNFRDQRSLGWIPATISRNVYGSQRESFLTTQDLLQWDKQTVSAYFIRAPRFDALGNDVAVLSRYKQDITGIVYRHFTAITYHPELSEDLSFHQAWAKQAHLLP
jgi:5'-phosphate synthase pdxT subunit